MPELDTLLLSRIQFAANISFHILFPTITIALGWILLGGAGGMLLTGIIIINRMLQIDL